MTSWNSLDRFDAGARHRMRGEERRIEGQHERLDALCEEVYSMLGKSGPAGAVNDFLLFAAALEAHMKLEEEVYFPTLHGLRADLSEELSDLVETHRSIREATEALKALFKAGDGESARLALDGLGRQFKEHEQIEEDLIARVNEGPARAV